MEIEEMKDRIAHIIRAKNLTAAEFAIRLGIQPSNISHLLSGRNNPSLDFVRKLKDTFPEYNLDWIVMGKGPMTVSEPFGKPVPDTHFPEAKEEETKTEVLAGTLFASSEKPYMPEKQQFPMQNPELKKLILVYDDNTFEVLLPR